MRTVVINLSRFGDLLQAQPTLSGLHARGEEISLVCLEQFAQAAALLRDIDEVRPLPGARFLARLDQAWPESLAALYRWMDEGQTGTRLVNLTPSLPAQLLGRALQQNDFDGFGLDDHGFGTYSTPWAAFLQAASKHRGCSPFNLVDVFQRAAGLLPGDYALLRPKKTDMDAAKNLLAHAPDKLVAFQLGASQEFRRWPVENFVRAGEVLWTRTGHVPVLVGSVGERHLARDFGQQATYPFIDLTGQTDLPTLAAVLLCTRLLLTNDTGTMHLAAGLGLPVAAIFLATAQGFDTGPYLEGSLCLEPDIACHPCSFGQQCPHDLACLKTVNALAVGEMLSTYLDCGRFCPPSDLGARAWLSQRDAFGFMDLVSLSGHESQDRSQWIRRQRGIYRQFLDEKAISPAPCAIWASSAFQDQINQELHRCILLLTLIEEQGRLLSRHPQAPLRPRFFLNCQNLEDSFARSTKLGVLGLLWRHHAHAQSACMDHFLGLCARYRELLTALQKSLTLA